MFLQAKDSDPRVTQLIENLSQSMAAVADSSGVVIPSVLVLNKVRAGIVFLSLVVLVLLLSFLVSLHGISVPLLFSRLQVTVCHMTGILGR